MRPVADRTGSLYGHFGDLSPGSHTKTSAFISGLYFHRGRYSSPRSHSPEQQSSRYASAQHFLHHVEKNADVLCLQDNGSTRVVSSV